MRALTFRILLAVFASATGAQAATYTVRHLDPNDALMAISVRVPEIKGDCRITPSHARDPGSAGVRGFLEVECSTQANYAKIQAALNALDTPPPTHRFHVAVLTASRDEGAMPDLSPGELKALGDFKKVMAYKSFWLEGETILQCDRSAQTPINGIYTLELVVDSNTGGGGAIDVRKFQLRASRVQTLPGGNSPYYENFVETSFSIKPAETIVLGTTTSDKAARVVLVTALP